MTKLNKLYREFNFPSYKIYCLFANGYPFYIGCSINPKSRLKSHLIFANTGTLEVNVYIRDCIEKRKKINYLILEEYGCIQRAKAAESYWIKTLSSHGIKLANTINYPTYGKKRSTKIFQN